MKGSSSISTAKKRLLNDLKQFNENDENETILATPHEDNLMNKNLQKLRDAFNNKK